MIQIISILYIKTCESPHTRVSLTSTPIVPGISSPPLLRVYIYIYITMKSFIAAAALATLASVAEAKKCQNITVPVTIEARLGMFGDLAPQNDIDITNFILNLAQQGKNFTEASLKGVSISFRSIAGNHSQLTIPI